ncbi:DUF2946 family protein [Rhodoferax sp. U11-2br]|uniref:DUF2946 family protein n=1 Tax=Rhodoferax sp. U11-2br TaxID=2838878 RepID=UPI001BE7BC80|nr:DUF2946 family protein [Rhodoferax sp. U11-2br]MBT3068533.1 DUF2946 family protein [Rhodoferax sp. U11-2br]
MPTLQSQREARSIVHWMLVWFALSIGVAVAAPVVNPQALMLICSAAGSVKFVAQSTGDNPDGAPSGMQGHTLDCVMCLPVGAPPLVSWVPATGPAVRSPQTASPPEHVPTRFANAASARGPPAPF